MAVLVAAKISPPITNHERSEFARDHGRVSLDSNLESSVLTPVVMSLRSTRLVYVDHVWQRSYFRDNVALGLIPVAPLLAVSRLPFSISD